MITLDGVVWRLDGRDIVRNVTTEIEDGTVVGLVGPNGCGKSSLLRIVAGLRQPSEGHVHIDGEDIHTWGARTRALRLSFVDQVAELSEDLCLADVVGLGRAPHASRWGGLCAADHEIVAVAMTRLGIARLADRSWRDVSGGERQRTQLARAIAQQAPHIILDEPTNHLDVLHQLELMEYLRESGMTVLVSLHDLGLAARYCDKVLMMRDGAVIADGPPRSELSAESIRRCFDVAADVEERPGTWAVSYSPIHPVAPPG